MVSPVGRARGVRTDPLGEGPCGLARAVRAGAQEYDVLAGAHDREDPRSRGVDRGSGIPGERDVAGMRVDARMAQQVQGGHDGAVRAARRTAPRIFR